MDSLRLPSPASEIWLYQWRNPRNAPQTIFYWRLFAKNGRLLSHRLPFSGHLWNYVLQNWETRRFREITRTEFVDLRVCEFAPETLLPEGAAAPYAHDPPRGLADSLAC